MRNLTKASKELFRRSPDETFDSLDELAEHCQTQEQASQEIWQSPRTLSLETPGEQVLTLSAGSDGVFQLNDWSFSQLCRLSGVSKDTGNRPAASTAGQVFRETLPRGTKPLQLFTEGESLRSIHAASYTRLYNSEVLGAVGECAIGFEPPPKGANGATGLYAGEQDMFCFLIDPAGWTASRSRSPRPATRISTATPN